MFRTHDSLKHLDDGNSESLQPSGNNEKRRGFNFHKSSTKIFFLRVLRIYKERNKASKWRFKRYFHLHVGHQFNSLLV